MLRYWYQFASVSFTCFFLITLGLYGITHSFPTDTVKHYSKLHHYILIKYSACHRINFRFYYWLLFLGHVLLKDVPSALSALQAKIW